MAQKLPAVATSCLGTGNDSSLERCFLIDQREGRKKKKKVILEFDLPLQEAAKDQGEKPA